MKESAEHYGFEKSPATKEQMMAMILNSKLFDSPKIAKKEILEYIEENYQNSQDWLIVKLNRIYRLVDLASFNYTDKKLSKAYKQMIEKLWLDLKNQWFVNKTQI